MLPGKVYTPEDVLRIARKRIWCLLLPLALVSASTAVWARLLPNKYRSESSIQVTPQRVPESYVRSPITAPIEQRLQSLRERILSSTKLQAIIEDFKLYPEERKTGVLQDIIDRMRTRDIQSQVIRNDAFRISYTGEDPGTVKAVTERLVSLFINENMGDRTQTADNTNVFLEGELAEAEASLVKQEKRLEEYRKRYAGQLPSELESNLQVLQAKQTQIQQAVLSLNRHSDKQVRLERAIEDLEQDIEDAASGALAPGPDGGTVAQQLEAARASLATLQQVERKLDDHPDVKTMKTVIRKLEQQVAAQDLDTDSPVSPDLRRLSPSEANKRKRLEELKLELAQVQRDMNNDERYKQGLENEVAVYRQNIAAIPTRETQFTEVTRDYESSKSWYLGLRAKQADAKMAAGLTTLEIGERFVIQETARRPERPFSPNRQRINLMGLAGGLGLGVLLVALLEYRDKSFKTDEEVARVLTLPVLAVVPFMQSAVEKRRSFRNQVVMNVGFGTTLLGCLAVVVYTLVR